MFYIGKYLLKAMTDYRRINATYDVDTKKTRVSLSKPFKKLDIDKQKEILEIVLKNLQGIYEDMADVDYKPFGSLRDE